MSRRLLKSIRKKLPLFLTWIMLAGLLPPPIVKAEEEVMTPAPGLMDEVVLTEPVVVPKPDEALEPEEAPELEEVSEPEALPVEPRLHPRHYP